MTVNLTRIYTRLGDGGETHLGDMSRVPKTHPRIEAYGTVDELNALLGLVLARGVSDELHEPLERIQNELFDLGADVALPAGERFTLEYVTDKPWSGYNWYQGNYRSLIQVNTDLPIYIDRALDLACHEGYPGHHVFNALREQVLVRQRGWVEYSVYPLFSPSSLIAEGSANYGIELAFTIASRMSGTPTPVFPLAGIAPEQSSPMTSSTSCAVRSGSAPGRSPLFSTATSSRPASIAA